MSISTKPEIVQFEKIHAYDILSRNVRENEAWISGHGDFEEFVKAWAYGGPAYTLIIDGEIILSGGVVRIGWNRGEAWALLSILFYKHIRTSFKAIMFKLEEIIFTEKFKRVQATVPPEFTEGIRFLEHLGFDWEGTMRSFGPRNEDMVMFSRICQ